MKNQIKFDPKRTVVRVNNLDSGTLFQFTEGSTDQAYIRGLSTNYISLVTGAVYAIYAPMDNREVTVLLSLTIESPK